MSFEELSTQATFTLCSRPMSEFCHLPQCDHGKFGAGTLVLEIIDQRHDGGFDDVVLGTWDGLVGVEESDEPIDGGESLRSLLVGLRIGVCSLFD